VGVVLLAAGRSTRFAGGAKLAWPLHGAPLGLHAARTLAGLSFGALVAVVAGPGVNYAALGYHEVVNPALEQGQSASIALGVAQARAAGVEAVLIALADMPFITADHLRALLAGWEGPDSIMASLAPQPMPPALFGAAWFDELERLTGDRGARHLLARARGIAAPSDTLVDIDRREDLPG
jgi:molybdenum cofactor cytidylyltransferase